MQQKPLNQRQQAFANAYLVSGNATQAAIEAGYAKGSARVTASRLLTNANISAAVGERQKEVSNNATKKAEVSLEWSLSTPVQNWPTWPK